jgi:hypothetical protein
MSDEQCDQVMNELKSSCMNVLFDVTVPELLYSNDSSMIPATSAIPLSYSPSIFEAVCKIISGGVIPIESDAIPIESDDEIPIGSDDEIDYQPVSTELTNKVYEILFLILSTPICNNFENVLLTFIYDMCSKNIPEYTSDKKFILLVANYLKHSEFDNSTDKLVYSIISDEKARELSPDGVLNCIDVAIRNHLLYLLT